MEILNWEIKFDKEATIAAYLTLPDQCDCVYCRNFHMAFQSLASEFFALLQIFGIDPAQPAEIVEYFTNPDGTHFYGWWYHLVGQIISGKESPVELAKGFK